MLKNFITSLYGLFGITAIEILEKFDTVMTKGMQYIIGILTIILLVYKIRNSSKTNTKPLFYLDEKGKKIMYK